MEETDALLLWGSNARETHPIFFHHLLKAVNRGARLFAIDPRRTSSAQWAERWLGLDVGTDIALANAMGREIIRQGLANEAFIRRATDGFEAYRKAVEPYTEAAPAMKPMTMTFEAVARDRQRLRMTLAALRRMPERDRAGEAFVEGEVRLEALEQAEDPQDRLAVHAPAVGLARPPRPPAPARAPGAPWR